MKFVVYLIMFSGRVDLVVYLVIVHGCVCEFIWGASRLPLCVGYVLRLARKTVSDGMSRGPVLRLYFDINRLCFTLDPTTLASAPSPSLWRAYRALVGSVSLWYCAS